MNQVSQLPNWINATTIISFFGLIISILSLLASIWTTIKQIKTNKQSQHLTTQSLDLQHIIYTQSLKPCVDLEIFSVTYSLAKRNPGFGMNFSKLDCSEIDLDNLDDNTYLMINLSGQIRSLSDTRIRLTGELDEIRHGKNNEEIYIIPSSIAATEWQFNDQSQYSSSIDPSNISKLTVNTYINLQHLAYEYLRNNQQYKDDDRIKKFLSSTKRPEIEKKTFFPFLKRNVYNIARDLNIILVGESYAEKRLITIWKIEFHKDPFSIHLKNGSYKLYLFTEGTCDPVVPFIRYTYDIDSILARRIRPKMIFLPGQL